MGIFVEGQTEMIFIEKLIKEIVNSLDYERLFLYIKNYSFSLNKLLNKLDHFFSIKNL
jgi:predicted ATP-dependent endonuclease of OLD family